MESLKISKIGASACTKRKLATTGVVRTLRLQVKEIVAYAAERFIEVIPEIELPGHCCAALACYPNLSCECPGQNPSTAPCYTSPSPSHQKWLSAGGSSCEVNHSWPGKKKGLQKHTVFRSWYGRFVIVLSNGVSIQQCKLFRA